MSDDAAGGRYKLVGFRIGETYCLSAARSVQVVAMITDALTQVPGTKPWVLGAAKLNHDLVLHINTARFLNIPASPREGSGQPSLIVRGSEQVGMVGFLVDEVLGFMPSGNFTDLESAEMRIPPGLGKSFFGVVGGHDRIWALIDLHQLVCDEKLSKIDLN